MFSLVLPGPCQCQPEYEENMPKEYFPSNINLRNALQKREFIGQINFRSAPYFSPIMDSQDVHRKLGVL